MAFFEAPFPFTRLNRIIIPDLPNLSLSQSEQETLNWLEQRFMRHRQLMELKDAYYRGEQVIRSLGIAIPPQLSHLRTIVGWPSKAVDPYVDRLYVDGFRLADATDSDMGLRDLWVGNGMDGEQTLAFTDALVMGRSYLTIGSAEDAGDPPVMCVESPLNIAVRWDGRYGTPTAALQTYWMDDEKRAALYLPDQTIQLATDEKGTWQIVNRDHHGFGWVPIVRLVNRPRTSNREGASEITPAVMSLTDLACRTLLNLTVASELYSVPQKAILGASEEDFQNPDGTKKSGWDTYITKVLALERDEDGNLPEIHQMTAYDPSVYTKVLDWCAAAVASEVNATPQDMGLYTQGNPPSADAVEYAEGGRNRRALKMQGILNPDLIKGMQMLVRFQNGGNLPDKYRRMQVDWADVATTQPTATADSITKQIAAGSIPATSDETLKRLGWSSVQRARLEQDRQLDPGAAELAELADSLQAKQARTDVAVATDINPKAAGAPSNGS